ncbi:MAG TPA: NAD(P)/FAD-dependent oxidoreductase [Acidimicrobiales bacterium]|nr:NAD(P)/FAD-dependent oxidoreductase [Acidimicrobiales bacterium]
MSEPETTTAAPADADAATRAGSVVVIGAGPAGLTAAYEMARHGVASTVLEGDDVVGGISRTVQRDGWRFDIGGHRFFTKVQRVDDFWHEILADDEFLLRPRKSRIYYRGRFFDYPIRVMNVLRTIGPVEAVRCVGSYAWIKVRPLKQVRTLEDYVVANYGWRLYHHFFETYSTKVWGCPPSEIGADWGAQRIKGMSLWSAVWEPLRARFAGRRADKSKQVTSLIDRFQYPKYGPGMMWERCRDLVEAAGTKVMMESPVVRIRHEGGRAVAVVAETDGVTTEYPADHVISSMPFPALLRAMDPPVPAEVVEAADDLHFRDFLSVALVVPAGKVDWTDNWIYIHAPEVKTMRVQNFGSWSPYMVDEGHNVLGLEYTVTEGDEWWTASDEELIEKGKAELETMGLMTAADVEAGYVVRMPKAYPVYDDTYAANVEVLRTWLTANAPNVHPVGRNGMHRYNNQDHSMYTAMLSVENIVAGTAHDIWAVNVEEEYHEEDASGASASSGRGGTGRDAPILPKPQPTA